MGAEIDSLIEILDLANVIIHDLDGSILHWTAGCERLYGWAREEAVGQVVHELLQTKYPVPRSEIVAALRERGSWQGELEHRTKDGSVVSIASLWVARISDDNSIRFVLQNNIDISRLKRAQAELATREAHLRSILDTVPEAMIVIDEQGQVTSFSAAAEKLFRYRADEVIGRKIKMLMPEPYRTEYDGYLANSRPTGEAGIIGYGRLVKGLTKDGTVFPMELTVGEAHADGERIFTGFARDLTSRQKMEEELRQSQKMEAIGQLTGGVAHDFNNLLTAIIGNLEMHYPHVTEPDQREHVQEALDAAQDGAKLAAQLLAFGRRQPLNPKPIDVGPLVSSFKGLLQRTLGETIELRILGVGSAQLSVVDLRSCSTRCSTFRSTPGMLCPGRTIDDRNNPCASRCRLCADVPGYPSRRLCPRYGHGHGIGNVGRGASARIRAVLHHQTDRRRHRTRPQHGLRVREAVGRAHPTLQRTRARNERASFLAAAEAPNGRGARAPKREAAELPQGSETILLVEDDPRLRRVLSKRLRSLGYQFIEADSGAAAMAQLADRPEIALVFTDMVMPGGMTGYDLAEAAWAIKPDLKVLFTSGYAEPGDRPSRS